MKRKLILLASFLLMVTQFYSNESEGFVIKNYDGKQSVNLVGCWRARNRLYSFTMIFDEDGKMTYGCNNSRSQTIIDLHNPEGLGLEYNNFWAVGTYKTAGNILIFSVEKLADYVGQSGLSLKKNTNFIVNIVSDDELVIQTSDTGNVRTYKRLY